jgi:hypothetical protein
MSDDFVARGDGSFTMLRDDRLFDLIYSSGTQRQWVPVASPFNPTKLTVRADHTMFALDDAGGLWQRLPDRHEHNDGVVTVRAEWRLLARSPT